jgi:hypothetical protein
MRKVGVRSNMCELSDLFAKYGTPKDGYPVIYEMLFRHQRQRITSVLEIGVGTMIPGARSSMVDWALPGYLPGGSLRAWRDWFPNATITGLDVQSDTLFTEPRIQTRLCDSQNGSEVVACLGQPSSMFDLIIDDADHSVWGQLFTCENIYPYLASGGYYIIEDATELPSDTDAMEELAVLVKPAARLVVTRQVNNLMNNLIIIFKADSSTR